MASLTKMAHAHRPLWKRVGDGVDRTCSCGRTTTIARRPEGLSSAKKERGGTLSARDPISVTVPDTSDLPRLKFRAGWGEADYADVFAVHVGSRAADQTDLQSTFEPYHGLITTLDDVAA